MTRLNDIEKYDDVMGKAAGFTGLCSTANAYETGWYSIKREEELAGTQKRTSPSFEQNIFMSQRGCDNMPEMRYEMRRTLGRERKLHYSFFICTCWRTSFVYMNETTAQHPGLLLQ